LLFRNITMGYDGSKAGSGLKNQEEASDSMVKSERY
jgi:hypothetical protein